MRLVAWLRGLPVRHRAWESAFPLSLGIALLLGVFLPVPGSVYPRQGAWHYRDLLPKLGPIAFAGAAAVLLFTWAAWALAGFGGVSPEVIQGLITARRAGLMLAAFDVLLPFSPFVSFNGQRLWICESPLITNDTSASPPTMGIDCNMTGGSSGGGWIVGNAVYSVNSYGYLNQPGVMYGPYQDSVAQSLYNRASVR